MFRPCSGTQLLTVHGPDHDDDDDDDGGGGDGGGLASSRSSGHPSSGAGWARLASPLPDRVALDGVLEPTYLCNNFHEYYHHQQQDGLNPNLDT